jgi:hypothetical protein
MAAPGEFLLGKFAGAVLNCVIAWQYAVWKLLLGLFITWTRAQGAKLELMA